MRASKREAAARTPAARSPSAWVRNASSFAERLVTSAATSSSRTDAASAFQTPSIQDRASAASVTRVARSAEMRASGVPSSHTAAALLERRRRHPVDQPPPRRVVLRQPAPPLARHVRCRRQETDLAQFGQRRDYPPGVDVGPACRFVPAPRRGSLCSGSRRDRRRSPRARGSRGPADQDGAASGRSALSPGASPARHGLREHRDGAGTRARERVSFVRASKRSPGSSGSVGGVPARPSPTSAASMSAFMPSVLRSRARGSYRRRGPRAEGERVHPTPQTDDRMASRHGEQLPVPAARKYERAPLGVDHLEPFCCGIASQRRNDATENCRKALDPGSPAEGLRVTVEESVDSTRRGGTSREGFHPTPLIDQRAERVSTRPKRQLRVEHHARQEGLRESRWARRELQNQSVAATAPPRNHDRCTRKRSSSSTIWPVIAHSSLTRSPAATTSALERPPGLPCARRPRAAPRARPVAASPERSSAKRPNPSASRLPIRRPIEEAYRAAEPERRGQAPARRPGEPPERSRQRPPARWKRAPSERDRSATDRGPRRRRPRARARFSARRACCSGSAGAASAAFSARCFFRSADSVRLPATPSPTRAASLSGLVREICRQEQQPQRMLTRKLPARARALRDQIIERDADLVHGVPLHSPQIAVSLRPSASTAVEPPISSQQPVRWHLARARRSVRPRGARES